MRDLVNVESIPFEVLDAGISWDWESFPEYMDAAARPQAIAQSRVSRAAHAVSSLRDGRGVHGARRRPHETREITTLLGEAIDAGAFGWSSTLLNQHMGYGGRPLACRNASREELKSYCNALRSRGKGRSSSR